VQSNQKLEIRKKNLVNCTKNLSKTTNKSKPPISPKKPSLLSNPPPAGISVEKVPVVKRKSGEKQRKTSEIRVSCFHRSLLEKLSKH